MSVLKMLLIYYLKNHNIRKAITISMLFINEVLTKGFGSGKINVWFHHANIYILSGYFCENYFFPSADRKNCFLKTLQLSYSLFSNN